MHKVRGKASIFESSDLTGCNYDLNMSLESVLQNIHPAETLFWSGAGISSDPPACLPLGNHLTEMLVKKFAIPGTWDKLILYIGAANNWFWNGTFDGYSKLGPRLEFILSQIFSIIKEESFLPLLKLFHTEPNRNHLFFAHHLLKGGRHITANIDDCIEVALKNVEKGSKNHGFGNSEFMKITHFHGVHCRNFGGLQNLTHHRLGLRMQILAQGFTPETEEVLEDNLSSSSWIIFCGYGGQDYFDVQPFFRNLNCRLDNTNIFWIEHSEDEIGFADYCKCGHGGLVILNRCEQLGAQVYYWSGPTAKVLGVLAGLWGFSEFEMRTADLSRGSSWRSVIDNVPVSEEEKILITASIWKGRGIPRELADHDRVLKQIQVESSSPRNRRMAIQVRLAQRRDSGRYDDALKLARKAWHQGLLSAVDYHHVRAGDFWLKGNHLCALRNFRLAQRALSHTDFEDVSTNDKQTIYILLTFLHWARDVRRSHSLRFLASAEKVRHIYLDLVAKRDLYKDDAHFEPKMLRLQQEIDCLRSLPKIEGRWEQQADTMPRLFSEVDSLLGTINFARRALVEQNIRNFRRIHAIAAMADLIGDRSGQLKAFLLLREEGCPIGSVFTPSLAILSSVQWFWPRRIFYLVNLFCGRYYMG